MSVFRTGHVPPPYRALLGVLGVLWVGTALAGNPPDVQPGAPVDTNTVLGRTNAARVADEINAADLGLVCDGSTDNGPVVSTLNARLALAGASKTAYFPPAALPCLTSVALSPPSGSTLRANLGTVTIKPTAASTANPVLFGVSGVAGVLVDGLTFDGALGMITNSNNVLLSYNSNRVVFDRVTIQNTRGIGLLFSNPATGGATTNSGIRRSFVTNAGNYWKTSGATSDQQQGVAFCCGVLGSNTGNFANDNFFSNTGLDALSVATQTDFQANDNRFRSVGGQYSNGGAAIYASNVDGLVLVGNDVDATFGNGLDLYSLSHFAVTGNKVRQAGGTGVSVASGTLGVVTGNLSTDSNQGNTSSLNSGLSMAGANDRVTWAGNTSTDDQATKTQEYGFQGLAGSTCTNCTIDGSNTLDGNAVANFGGTVTTYTSRVSATVAWGAQVGSGANWRRTGPHGHGRYSGGAARRQHGGRERDRQQLN